MEHIVLADETLSGIAAEHGVRLEDLVSLNKFLNDPDFLQVQDFTRCFAKHAAPLARRSARFQSWLSLILSRLATASACRGSLSWPRVPAPGTFSWGSPRTQRLRGSPDQSPSRRGGSRSRALRGGARSDRPGFADAGVGSLREAPIRSGPGVIMRRGQSAHGRQPRPLRRPGSISPLGLSLIRHD